MLQLLGRSNSINVRKVLWLCDEIGAAPMIEAYGAGFRSTATPEFESLNPNAMVPVLIDHATDPPFVLCVVLGLSTHRRYATPMPRPALAAVDAYYRRLAARPGFRRHGIDAGP